MRCRACLIKSERTRRESRWRLRSLENLLLIAEVFLLDERVMSSVVEVKLTLLLHLVLPDGLHLKSFIVVLRQVEDLG